MTSILGLKCKKFEDKVKGDIPQSFSSEPSTQSMSPSHTQSLEMYALLLLQANVFLSTAEKQFNY